MRKPCESRRRDVGRPIVLTDGISNPLTIGFSNEIVELLNELFEKRAFQDVFGHSLCRRLVPILWIVRRSEKVNRHVLIAVIVA